MKIHSTSKNQEGAALLAFMLIVIIGTSFLLVTKLNANLVIVEGDLRTRLALNLAKEALIGYAATYPDNVNSSEGPGYLPCPDTDKDGDAESNCSDAGNTTIGRVPYKTLEITDIRDSSGQHLWYALSENFRYGSSKIVPLNSESPASAKLTLNGTDDIVAIIIAPGEPMLMNDCTTQSRDPDETLIINEIQNYLEGDNSNLDTSFVTSTAQPACIYDDSEYFNDMVVVITRDELMTAVEKRVLGEVKTMLASYNTTYGAYPLLTPFADPKADFRVLTGKHRGSDNSSNLVDTTKNFIDWDIQPGDFVINTTNGSIGTVNIGVTATSLPLSWLSLGAVTENDFDINVVSDNEDNDRYAVYKKNGINNLFRGIGTSGSNNLTLNDTAKDFKELGVSAGDIVDNLDDGSSGMVEEVLSSTRLIVKSLTGGAINQFTSGDGYQIRSNVGQTTGGSGGLMLKDTDKDFSAMGIRPGDLIVNITDGSVGMVNAINSDTTDVPDVPDDLTVTALKFGTDNDFDTNDYYYLPRYNTDSSAREGLLAFHEEGKLFPTAFDVDFSITAHNDDVEFDTTNFPGTQATYQAALGTFLTSYASNPLSLTYSIDLTEGVCRWLSPKIADCYFNVPPENINISGTITSGSNTPVITDSNADFVADGVKRGDIVQNYDDEFPLSPPVSGTADEGGTTGAATTGSSNLTLEDTSKNFITLGISVGDDIINTTDGSSGMVASIAANQITVTSLSGGTNNIFAEFDNYQILHSELYDASTNFTSAGIEPYQYLVYNNTTGIRAVITDIIDDNRIDTAEFENQSGPITFTPGDSFTIYTPGIVVVTDDPVTIPTVANTSRATSYNPDFDLIGIYPEYYRIIPAAGLFNGTVDTIISGPCTASTPCQIEDLDGNFITKGIVIGDIIENTSDAPISFGEITGVNATTITTTLYSGSTNIFTAGNSYNVYHKYAYSRRAEWHARFSGDQETKTLSEKRVRDVCLGYSSNDCSVAPTAVQFSGNGGVPLITIRDYAKDGTTEVGRATFIPSSASTGSLRLAEIDYYLAESSGDIPEWFLKNKWHQLVYIAHSDTSCDPLIPANCLTVTGSGMPDADKQAVVIIAGEETDSKNDGTCNTAAITYSQDRTTGQMVDYFEMENRNQGDDIFQRDNDCLFLNDQARIIE